MKYYAERTLAPGESDPRGALAAARDHPARLLLCDRERRAEVEAAGRPTWTVLEGLAGCCWRFPDAMRDSARGHEAPFRAHRFLG